MRKNVCIMLILLFGCFNLAIAKEGMSKKFDDPDFYPPLVEFGDFIKTHFMTLNFSIVPKCAVKIAGIDGGDLPTHSYDQLHKGTVFYCALGGYDSALKALDILDRAIQRERLNYDNPNITVSVDIYFMYNGHCRDNDTKRFGYKENVSLNGCDDFESAPTHMIFIVPYAEESEDFFAEILEAKYELRRDQSYDLEIGRGIFCFVGAERDRIIIRLDHRMDRSGIQLELPDYPWPDVDRPKTARELEIEASERAYEEMIKKKMGGSYIPSGDY